VTEFISPDAVETTEPAPTLAPENDTAGLPIVTYCVTAKQAKAALQEMLDDADGRLLGLDIETTASPAEAARLKSIELRQAALKGELKAARKAKAPASEIAAIEAEQKLLKAQIKFGRTAALDPSRARTRLVQAYGGGRRVAVIDLFRTGPGVLRLLGGLDIVAHNAAFEVAHLEHAGVGLGATHCSMQMARLTLGERSMSLADAVKAHLGVELDKTEQVGDWSTPDLSLTQIEYAALDAVMAFRLAERILPVLGPQTPAYEIQAGCTPAVARMRSRGVHLDLEAHAMLMGALKAQRVEVCAAYKQACIDRGLIELAAKEPTTPALKRAALEAILTGNQLLRWRRTKKTGLLSTARSDLNRAVAYPPIKALTALSKLDKLLSAFGPTLVALVSPATGRIHANYRVAADTTGRASCSYPNIQQVPRTDEITGIDFRALFTAAEGCKLVGGDYAYHEMRAAAAISGDQRMTEVFINGEDPHLVTACGMLGKRPEDMTKDERKAARQSAKPINFGVIYGCGAGGLAVSPGKTTAPSSPKTRPLRGWIVSPGRTPITPVGADSTPISASARAAS
jgi:DNA polymerase-1